jgi:hypothetical protein
MPFLRHIGAQLLQSGKQASVRDHFRGTNQRTLWFDSYLRE